MYVADVISDPTVVTRDYAVGRVHFVHAVTKYAKHCI